MNTGRFVGAAVATFVARFLMNFLFYGVLTQDQFQAVSDAHPGVFREVIPAYAVLDLIAAFLIAYFVARAGASFGAGIGRGVTIGVLLGIFGPVLASLYHFFSVTYLTTGMLGMEIVYQLVAHAIQGAVAAAVYKAT